MRVLTTVSHVETSETNYNFPSTTAHQTISLLFPTEVDNFQKPSTKMTPSDGFWQGFVFRMVIASIMIFLLKRTSRQERQPKKRGPEENDDNSF